MRLLSSYLTEGVHDKAVLKAVFVVGAPGSGKTYLGKKLTDNFGFKHISSDKIFEFIMKQDGEDLNLKKVMTAADMDYIQDLRRFSRQVMYREKDIYLKNRLGLLIDTPGYGDYVVKDKKKLEYLGYDTMMLFVRTKLKTSITRNDNRERKIPTHVVSSIHKSVMDALPLYIKVFGKNLTIVDNDVYDNDRDEFLWKEVMHFVNAPVRNKVGQDWIRRNSKNY